MRSQRRGFWERRGLLGRRTMARRNRGKGRRRELARGIQRLEDRTLLAVLTGDGGQGGTTETAQLDPGLNLVRFEWENFSIPDEFQILFKGRRIAGDVGLQSGGERGETVVTADNSSDQLTVKVTAPLQGTAWNFTVETLPFELNVDGNLGDVIKVDIVELLQRAGVSLSEIDFDPEGFALSSMTNTRGKVAEIDNFADELRRGTFYFVPTVTGDALNYDAARSDAGLGESELMVTNNGNEFPIKFRITDGFSTQGDNAVTFDNTKKLDVFRQQQRLAYFGFPDSSGNGLEVDGALGAKTKWAQKVFNVAVNPAVTGRGIIPNQGTDFYKAHINSVNAPFWNGLTTVPNLTFSGTQRTFGMNTSGQLVEDALDTLGTAQVSTGISRDNGRGNPSSTHDGGRSVDIDDTPGDFFRTRAVNGTLYVASPGGMIIVRDGNGFRAGDPSNPADVANGLTNRELVRSTNADLVNAISGLLDYKLAETDVRDVLDAFIDAGSPVIFYNDPRVLGGVVEFSRGHFNHYHIGIPSPISAPAPSPLGGPTQFLVAPEGEFNFGGEGEAIDTGNVVDLGQLEGTELLTGRLDAIDAVQIYRIEIGEMLEDFEDRTFFDTLRELNVRLDGITHDVDIELLADLTQDGVLDEGELLASSENSGTAAEEINAIDLETNVYFVRVTSRSGPTDFSISIGVPPLPVPTDNAGNSLAQSSDLGVLNVDVVRNDFIGAVDPIDLYRFEITELSEISVLLGELQQGDATLLVGQDENSDGILDLDEAIAFSDADGNAVEQLALTALPAGEYFIQVSINSGNTDYELSLSSTSTIVPLDQAGDTPAGALDIGILSTPFTGNDFVGGIDPVDLYRFTTNAITGVVIELSELTADADLELYVDRNADGILQETEVLAASRLSGTDTETIDQLGLASGEYFIRVLQYEGNTGYELSVTPKSAEGADLIVTRSDVQSAPDLGVPFTYTLTVTNNGPDTATDVTLTESAPIGLRLIGATASSAPSNVQVRGTEMTGQIPSLAAGESVSFDITASSYIAGDLPTFSNLASTSIDYDTSDNTLVDFKSVETIVSPDADLELTQSLSNGEPALGDQITITLELTNQGPGTATVIQVRDDLPEGLQFVSSNADLGSYNPTTGLWTVGNMPPNTSVQLRIVAEVVQAAVIINTAELVAVDEADPDSTPGNGLADEDDQASQIINVGGGVKNPGFSYVDANNDGLFSEQDQDVPLVTGELDDGEFSTDESEGGYADVIDGAGLVINVPVAAEEIELVAEGDLYVNANLTAADGDVVLESEDGSVLLVDPILASNEDIQIKAERDFEGDADDELLAMEEVSIEVGGNVSAIGLTIRAREGITISAEGNINAPDAQVMSEGDVELEAEGNALNVPRARLESLDGDIELESEGDVDARDSTLSAKDEVEVEAGTSISLDGADIQTSELSTDVNDDGRVTAIDALLVINYLARNAGEEREIYSTRYDTNNDSLISPADALSVINRLADPAAEGESSGIAVNPPPAQGVMSSDDDDRLLQILAEAQVRGSVS